MGLGDALETELFWNKKLGSMFTNVGKTKKESWQIRLLIIVLAMGVGWGTIIQGD